MSLQSQRQRLREYAADIPPVDSAKNGYSPEREPNAGNVAQGPIRTLPCELLAEIFQLLVSSGVRFKDVFTLTQVCLRWRQVGQTTPRLWSRGLPIEVGSLIPRRTPWYLTKVFLERSAPLSFPVHFCFHGPDSELCMKELLGAVNRWRTLRAPISSFKALAQIQAGLLENLEAIDLGGYGSGLESQTTVFLSAPRLHSVILVNVDPLHFFPMPWLQLTHLTLWTRSTSTQTCLDTVILCTNLVTARLNTESWPDAGISSLENAAPTTLSRLQDLGIFFKILSPGEHLMPFLHHLHLPALKTLRVCLYDPSSFFRWSGPAFHLFQIRSAHIKFLTLDNCNITSQELRDVLLQAVDLTDLKLVECKYCANDDLLYALRYRPSNAVHLAPKLENLVLESVVCDFVEENLDAMINSRWWTDEALLSIPTPAVARLKSVKYLSDGFSKMFTPRFMDKVERYRSEGLILEGFKLDDGSTLVFA